MKKSILLIAFILILSLASAGCNDSIKTATLWPGTMNDTNLPFFKTQPWEYKGELTVEILAEGLSQTTGLDYFVTAKKVPDGISVDWSKNSTLIADLDDRKQKEEFFFYDSYSLRWFMMDSLLLTIKDNLAPENVYYTMDDGKDLVFEALAPIDSFPADLPYMGTSFYFAHEEDQDEPMG